MAYPDDVPVLTDGVVTLRAYTMDDLDGCVEQCTDPLSVAWTTVPVPYDRDEGVTWITKTVPQSWAEATDHGFAIEAAHADGVRRFAGGISLRPKGEGIAEIGYGLHPGARGRGVASRAIKLIVDWGFGPAGFDVIIWFAFVGNWASRRLAWANGFTFDGCIPGFLPQRGIRRDSWVASLRATDPREPKHPWHDPPVLETDRLRLRPFADADATRLHEMNHDERSIAFGGRVPGTRPPTGELALLRIREQCASGQIINWCVADRATDVLLGKIQLFDLAGLDDTEVKPGYIIHPDARGRGILTEALRALVEWCFRPVSEGGLGKRRITISTARSNAASRHAAEQAGFTHIATIPTGFPLTPTEFDDEVLYQVTNPAWQPQPAQVV